MELRDIEIFLTLAEELHFGRTAERLHVSQARVSQAIKQQERRIGAPLFERSSRRVVLTPIGEQLHADLEIGYRRIVEAVESATAVARGERGRLVLGIIGPLVHEVTAVMDRFRAQHPDSELVIREITFANPFGTLRAGEVDVALVWLPVREPDLSVGPVLVTVPLVVAASDRHPLAARGRVCMEDLGDHPVMRPVLPVPDYWEEAVQPRTTPSGRPINRGPSVGTWNEIMAALSVGEAVCLVGADAIKYHDRPGISYLPIDDGPVLRWGLIWRTDAERPLVRAFAEIARTHRPVDLSHLTSMVGTRSSSPHPVQDQR